MMTGNLLARTGSASAVHAPSYNGQGYDRTTNQLRTVNRHTLCRRARLVGRLSAASLAAEETPTHDEVSGPVTCKACLKHIDRAHDEAQTVENLRRMAIDAQHERALEENARRDNPCGWLVSMSGRLHIPAANGAARTAMCNVVLSSARKPITGYWCTDCIAIRDEVHERALRSHVVWTDRDDYYCPATRPGTGDRCALPRTYSHTQHNDGIGRTWTDNMGMPHRPYGDIQGFHGASSLGILRTGPVLLDGQHRLTALVSMADTLKQLADGAEILRMRMVRFRAAWARAQRRPVRGRVLAASKCRGKRHTRRRG